MSVVENIQIVRDTYEPALWRFAFPDCVRSYDDEYYQIVNNNNYGRLEADIEKLEKLLKKCPHYLDAYNSLASSFLDCDELDLAIQVWRKGFDLINAIFPTEFEYGKDKIEYYIIDNRAYFRVCYGMAYGLITRAQVLNRKLLKTWDYEEAAKILETLVTVYPNDNIGARRSLPECYLYLQKYQEILNLLKKYPEGASHELEYGSVLAALKLNRINQASKLLTRAITNTPLVGEILLLKSPKELKAEDYNDDYITCGSGYEAYKYWLDYNCFWDDKAKSFINEGKDLIESVKSEKRSLWGSAIPEEYRSPYPKDFSLEGCGIC